MMFMFMHVVLLVLLIVGVTVPVVLIMLLRMLVVEKLITRLFAFMDTAFMVVSVTLSLAVSMI